MKPIATEIAPALISVGIILPRVTASGRNTHRLRLRHRRIPALISVMIGCLLLSGCGAREINDVALVSGAALDLDPATGTYTLSVEIADGLPETKDSPAEYEVASATGATPAEAAATLRRENGRDLYTSHCKILILSPSTAKNGLEPVLDWIFSEQVSRISMDLVLWNGERAAAFWDLTTYPTGIRAMDLEDMILTARNASSFPRLEAYEALALLCEGNASLLLPAVTAGKDGTPILCGAAAFNGQQFSGDVIPSEDLQR